MIRVIEMAEREQERQTKRDEAILTTNENDSVSNRRCAERSQIFGFIIAILFLIFLFVLLFCSLVYGRLETALTAAIVTGFAVGIPTIINSLRSNPTKG